MKAIPDRVTKRAYEKYIEDENGCYISTYSTGSHGYAQVGWQLSNGAKRIDCTTAHRAAWTHVHGQIPERMDIDHRETCDRRCVNVDHLRLLTPEENRRRCKGDFKIGQSCKRGHPPGARVKTKRGMVCRMCNTARVREFYERKRQAALAS
ncbi:HNH endonuclease signature motif containing protein [Mycobacterium sp. CSUR Q5927]|nr:HNH endonuclease signature motif containing protein [Mycobacterium sp. CSUR Q5927]